MEPEINEFIVVVRRHKFPNGKTADVVKSVNRGIPEFEAIAKVDMWLRKTKDNQFQDFQTEFYD